VNDRIRGVSSGFEFANDRYDLFCECSHTDCIERLEVPAVIYDRLRTDAGVWVVRAGHEPEPTERVLDTDSGYRVVFAA
jgi:hypothetical protein